MAQKKARRPEARRGKVVKSRVEKRKSKPKQKIKSQNTTQARLDAQWEMTQGKQATWPYGVNDRILLIGEGDFSFAMSLARTGGCKYVTATCFDSEEEVEQKYPQAVGNVEALRDLHLRVIFGVDATKMSAKVIRRPPLPPRTFKPATGAGRLDEGEGREQIDKNEGGSHRKAHSGANETADVRGWDIISFNFPHVGGKSTDVNRQVRYNQSLLVSFFKAACPLLTPPSSARPAGGVILVTLFEGEPYTLWNVKDLGRHSGLRAARSWSFDFNKYPGYDHVRTLGVIEGGGGWKGKNRAARTYAFVRQDAPADAQLFAIHPQSFQKRSSRDTEDEGEDESD